MESGHCTQPATRHLIWNKKSLYFYKVLNYNSFGYLTKEGGENTMVDYERDKLVDLNHLHFEWMRQVQLAKYYEEEVVQAKKKVDDLEEAVKVEEALAGERARERLSGGKFTVDMVRDAVLLDPDLRVKKEQYRQAVLELGLCRAASKSIDTKKSALEGIVELWKREYFGTPFEHRDYEEWEGKRFTQDTAKVLRDQANDRAKEAAQKRRTERS